MDPAIIPKDHKSAPILPTFANRKTSTFKKTSLEVSMDTLYDRHYHALMISRLILRAMKTSP